MSAAGKMIAVIDDEPTMRRALERLLTAHGFIPQGFASAEAFLDSGLAAKVNCVVLDIHLEGMSGIELGRRLKVERATLPVIYITALDKAAIKRAAAEVGYSAFLRKPFSAEQLISAVHRATS